MAAKAALEEKGTPVSVSPELAGTLLAHLRDSRGGHYPIVTNNGDVVAVVVSLDRFNVLLHWAELMDDPEIAAAVAKARQQKDEGKEERYLSLEEVF